MAAFDPTCSLDSLSENKIGDKGVSKLSATFPQLKALETLK
jgi:class II major histocompatibility complex transactivator